MDRLEKESQMDEQIDGLFTCEKNTEEINNREDCFSGSPIHGSEFVENGVKNRSKKRRRLETFKMG